MANDDLAAAAGEALDDSAGELQMSQQQEALIPACKVKFQGMAFDKLDEVPSLRDEMRFEVIGTVIGHETTVMADGEEREVAKVKVSSVKQL